MNKEQKSRKGRAIVLSFLFVKASRICFIFLNCWNNFSGPKISNFVEF